jgi:hypothetical protein
VPIVVELLLRLMARRGIRPAEVTASRHGQTSAKPRSGRSQAKSAKPIVHPNTRAKSKQAAVLALLIKKLGLTLQSRQCGGRAHLSRDPRRRGRQGFDKRSAAGGLIVQQFVQAMHCGGALRRDGRASWLGG